MIFSSRGESPEPLWKNKKLKDADKKKIDLNAEAKLHIQQCIENPIGRLGWNSQTSIIFAKRSLL